MEDNTEEKQQTSPYDAFWIMQKKALRHSFINSTMVILNIIIFVICVFTGSLLYQKGALILENVRAGEYYRLVTAMFLHGDLQHILGNMMLLVFMGSMVEEYIGHIQYFILYFIAGIGGNILSLWYESLKGLSWYSYGASGAAFGIIGAFLVIIIIGRKTLRKGTGILIRTLLLVAFSIYSSFADANVNYAAHIGGLVFGMIFTGIISFGIRKQINLEEWI
ncbi:MAG: rhomboid family intramembrane serine protease [Butyrivibrio sp.]|nr:rhomboid family intramembrane serine protease [Butyrivibrio sp.]